MKRIWIAAALLVAVTIGAALWLLHGSLDRIVAREIERAGTAAAGVPVRVGAVSLDLARGRGTVRGLRVANPEGFSHEAAIEAEVVEVALDVRSLAGPGPVVLDEVRVAAPLVRFELDELGAANLDVIRRNLRDAPREAGAEPFRLRIRSLALEEGTLLSDTRDVSGDERRVRLPALEMDDPGGRSATPAQVGQEVLLAVVQQAAFTAARSGLQRYLESEIEELGERAKDALRGIFGEREEEAR
jgi:hypothetical protein